MTVLVIAEYRKWLRGLVEGPDLNYDLLFDSAWHYKYKHYIQNDQNRAKDGIALRGRFESESSTRLPKLGECSILEMLIGLSIRMNETLYDYENPDLIGRYFWELIENLEIDSYTDEYLDWVHRGEFEVAFEVLNKREYNRDGSWGGLFPIENPEEDQRTIEIWYQMMAYMSENM